MWYTVQTKPRVEDVAGKSLIQKGLEIYLPRVSKYRRRGATRYYTSEPLFPGYLFVNPGRNPAPDTISRIKWSLGVRQLLCAGRIPLILPDEAIYLIKWRIGEGSAEIPKISREFPAGSMVAIRYGAFEGLIGVVDRTIPARERVRVFLDFMHRQTPVELDPVLLDRVS